MAPSFEAPGLSPVTPAAKSSPDIQSQSKTTSDHLPRVQCLVRARVPTTTGSDAWMYLYENDIDNREHLAIAFGSPIWSRSLNRIWDGETELERMVRGAYTGKLYPGRSSSWNDDSQLGAAVDSVKPASTTLKSAPLVRVHSECFTGETAWSTRCDCGEQFDEAGRLMVASLHPASSAERYLPDGSESPQPSAGVIVYLRQEGRGIGLKEKLKTFNVQDLGRDTLDANLFLNHPADARNFSVATAILVDLGLGVDNNPEGIRLLTNNPNKLGTVGGPHGEVKIRERVPMIPLAWKSRGQVGIQSPELEGYLDTKASLLLATTACFSHDQY
ncbi:GTP cyclohydrolase II [Microsporum audouinii]